ncbi:MAG: hypothetical protein PGN13_03535 [Patulibacter minatonensis]
MSTDDLRHPTTIADPDTGEERPLTPEEGGSQSGTQIDESRIDEPQDPQSPTTENDVT